MKRLRVKTQFALNGRRFLKGDLISYMPENLGQKICKAICFYHNEDFNQIEFFEFDIPPSVVNKIIENTENIIEDF